MACNSPLKPSSETEKMDDGDAIIVSVYIVILTILIMKVSNNETSEVDLKFVSTVTIGGRVKIFPAV